MAKIKNFEFMLDKEHIKQPINVNAKGEFYSEFRQDIAEKLNIQPHITGESLKSLEMNLNKHINNYKESSKKYEEVIGISFQSSGWYFDNKMNGKFQFATFSHYPSAIAFEFAIYVKEIRDSGHLYYEAGRVINLDEESKRRLSEKIIDKLFTRGVSHNRLNNTIFIPYSDEAFDTLTSAAKGLEKIANILYGILSQDVLVLNDMLKGLKLLAPPDNEQSTI